MVLDLFVGIGSTLIVAIKNPLFRGIVFVEEGLNHFS